MEVTCTNRSYIPPFDIKQCNMIPNDITTFTTQDRRCKCIPYFMHPEDELLPQL